MTFELESGVSATGQTGASKTQRQAWASAERSRARVGLGLSLWVGATALLVLPWHIARGYWPAILSDVLGLAFSLALAHKFRRPGPVRAPAMLLLGGLFAIVFVLISSERGLVIALSPWPSLLALFALYMLGPRPGLIFTGLAIVQALLSFFLHRAQASLPLTLIGSWDLGMAVISAVMGTGLIAVLGYVYETTQRRTMTALEDALVLTERNEDQLDALIESTTAAICAFDRDQRLLTCNRAFARMVGARSPLALQAGDALADLLPEAQRVRWQPYIDRLLRSGFMLGESGRMTADTGPITFEEPPPAGKDAPHRETTMHPMLGINGITGVTVFSHDITARKQAEAEMHRLHQDLVRVSREAGMAAVASEVLHNAGNVLNSTGVSVAMLRQHLNGLRVEHLARAVAMLDEHAGNLDAFLRDDPRGSRLFELLRGLAEHFVEQRQQLGAEVIALQGSIEHLVRIIEAQQSHARSLGVLETVSVAELVDAALELQALAGNETDIAVERHLPALPPLFLDKHKAIGILVSLISNARHALSGRDGKRLVFRAEAAGPEHVRIHVEDNGSGIDPADRDKLFRLGFTTKQDGSGIGLHSSANAAQQLGGSLSFHSDGPGRGAVFTLELPVGQPRTEAGAARSTTPGDRAPQGPPRKRRPT